MLYSYTPQKVGGIIVSKSFSGHFHQQEHISGDNLVTVQQKEDGTTLVLIFENGKIKNMISNFEMEFEKFEKIETSNYYQVATKSIEEIEEF